MGNLIARIPMTFWILFIAASLIGPSVGFGVFFVLFAIYLLLFKGMFLGILFAGLLVIFWNDFQNLEGAVSTVLIVVLLIWIVMKMFSRQ